MTVVRRVALVLQRLIFSAGVTVMHELYLIGGFPWPAHDVGRDGGNTETGTAVVLGAGKVTTESRSVDGTPESVLSNQRTSVDVDPEDLRYSQVDSNNVRRGKLA